jgi:hypothetical protein
MGSAKKAPLASLALLASALPLLSLSAACANHGIGSRAPSPPPMARPAFLVGYDEGWFADHYATDYTSAFDLAYVNRTFDGLVRAGGHVVRLWLFEGAQGIGMGAGAPRTLGVSRQMLANLELVLAAARARGLWVYVTALDGNETYAAPGALAPYFKALLNDPNELEAYLTRVLAPTLAVLDQHRDNVFGFDLMNEIEAPIQKGVFDDAVGGPRRFMQVTRAFVRAHSPWLPVTSSAGWSTAASDIASGLFAGVGLDFYDLHAYADSGEITGSGAVCERARRDGVLVILGEFGQSSPIVDDAIQSAATERFLSTARSTCFQAALAWRYDYSALPNSNWFHFIRADGSFRPAVSRMQQGR